MRRNGKPMAAASWKVQAVYIPRGKTMPQYEGSYVNGRRLTPCRQRPRVKSRGIHHVAVTQKKSVNPFKKGRMSCTNVQ